MIRFFKKIMRQSIVNFFLLLAPILVFSGAASASEAVRVAVAGPMIGTSNAVGIQYKIGVTAALSTLPDGKLLGRPVAINLYDDNCDESIAEAVAQQIVENPPAVVIGHSCSGATIAAAPAYAAHKVLQITPASTNPKATEMGFTTIFRMIGRDDLQGRLAAERIATKHAGRRVGVMSFSSPYSSGLSGIAIAHLKELGVTPVAAIAAQASKSSYTDAIAELLKHRVEALYLVGGALDCGIFLRQARQMGATFAVVSSDTLVSDVFVKAAGDAANNAPFTFPPDAVQLPTAAPAVAIIKAFEHEPAGYTLLAYASAQVWIEGVKRAQSFDTGKVAEAIRSEPTQTILGKIAFDEKGDIITPYAPFAWYVWKDGRRVPLD